MSTQKGQTFWKRAKKIIPGGNQLLSKRPEMFLPEQWPAYYKKAKGIVVEDLDGNRYRDFSIMGIGSCPLGYADPDVNKAVKRAVDAGSMATLNAPEEVELAELLCKIHPWAGMVRFTRTGGEAMAVAVRIARAHSGKEKVAFCGYHGWPDWYLAANLSSKKTLDGHLLPGLEPTGVPRGLKGTVLPFHYNRIEELEAIVEKHDIGVIVMEPVKHDEPKDNFLKKVRAIANRTGAVLIFDEVSSGFRLTIGGAHLKYGVSPDIAVFAKAISNGYPMAAVIGHKKVMQSAQDSFISSTYWTDRIGPVAALATIKKIQSHNVPAHLQRKAETIHEELGRLAQKHGLLLSISKPSPILALSFDYGKESQAIRTLFTQEMLTRGFLASNVIFTSFSHRDSDIKRYLAAVDEVFAELADAIERNEVQKRLKGPVAQTGFARLN